MEFRRLSLAAAVLALAVPATAGAAQAPPGIPDLAAMAVERADLPRGSRVVAEGYVDVPDTQAYYYRAFRVPRRSGVARLTTGVGLFADDRETEQLLAGYELLLRDPGQRRGFARLLAQQVGVRGRPVRVGRVRELHVGDGALAVTIRVGRKTVVSAMVRLDRVVAEVDVLGTGRGKRAMRRARALLRTTSDHVRLGLSPVSESPPTVTGSGQVGSALQAGPGAWSDATRPASFAYQWQRCDAAGAGCVPIPGATQPAYTVTATDRAATLRVAVTATNAIGSTTAVSAPTPAF